MRAGDLQENICKILSIGRDSWTEDGGGVIWQRLSIDNGEDMEDKCPEDNYDGGAHDALSSD